MVCCSEHLLSVMVVSCIFAPWVHHGPLDLQAIRDVDAGTCTANEAFIHAEVLKNTTYAGRKELLESAARGEKNTCLRLILSLCLL
ncbi:MAG TPA: hypothetical protein C5S50_02545 [Methanosarcinaceae archaeon]|nr:hypothetical protein [Methanosarcinaceae archaeon]